MSNISKIKYCDNFGYQIAELDVSGINEMVNTVYGFINAIGQMGISASDAAEAIQKVSELLNRTCELESRFCRFDNIDAKIQCDINYLQRDLSDIRSVVDVLSENLKQKDDLEISEQIVIDPDFQRLSENMFLNNN